MAQTTSNKLLMAGILGFAAGILYAPRKGTETQAEVKKKFGQIKQEAASKADQVKGKLREMKHKEESVLEKVDQKMDKVAAAVES